MNSGWFWAKRSTRFDVYPKEQPLVRLRVEPTGWGDEVRLFHENGAKVIEPYELIRAAEAPAAKVQVTG
ncbi:MAG: hypothetical protein WC565_07005 [Parcubacteria group bacterium]